VTNAERPCLASWQITRRYGWSLLPALQNFRDCGMSLSPRPERLTTIR
jgi:hypothetical protein